MPPTRKRFKLSQKKSARQKCVYFHSEKVRKRVFISTLGCLFLKDFLEEQGLSVDEGEGYSDNFFTIENFDIADIKVGNARIDCRCIVNEEYKQLWIPKKPHEFGYTFDFYAAISIDSTKDRAEIIGFVSYDDIKDSLKTSQDKINYYVIDISTLKPPLELASAVIPISKAKKDTEDFKDTDHDLIHELFSRYLDNELSYREKNFFDKHISTCDACREDLLYLYILDQKIKSTKNKLVFIDETIPVEEAFYTDEERKELLDKYKTVEVTKKELIEEPEEQEDEIEEETTLFKPEEEITTHIEEVAASSILSETAIIQEEPAILKTTDIQEVEEEQQAKAPFRQGDETLHPLSFKTGQAVDIQPEESFIAETEELTPEESWSTSYDEPFELFGEEEDSSEETFSEIWAPGVPGDINELINDQPTLWKYDETTEAITEELETTEDLIETPIEEPQIIEEISEPLLEERLEEPAIYEEEAPYIIDQTDELESFQQEEQGFEEVTEELDITLQEDYQPESFYPDETIENLPQQEEIVTFQQEEYVFDELTEELDTTIQETYEQEISYHDETPETLPDEFETFQQEDVFEEFQSYTPDAIGEITDFSEDDIGLTLESLEEEHIEILETFSDPTTIKQDVTFETEAEELTVEFAPTEEYQITEKEIDFAAASEDSGLTLEDLEKEFGSLASFEVDSFKIPQEAEKEENAEYIDELFGQKQQEDFAPSYKTPEYNEAEIQPVAHDEEILDKIKDELIKQQPDPEIPAEETLRMEFQDESFGTQTTEPYIVTETYGESDLTISQGYESIPGAEGFESYQMPDEPDTIEYQPKIPAAETSTSYEAPVEPSYEEYQPVNQEEPVAALAEDANIADLNEYAEGKKKKRKRKKKGFPLVKAAVAVLAMGIIAAAVIFTPKDLLSKLPEINIKEKFDNIVAYLPKSESPAGDEIATGEKTNESVNKENEAQERNQQMQQPETIAANTQTEPNTLLQTHDNKLPSDIKNEAKKITDTKPSQQRLLASSPLDDVSVETTIIKPEPKAAIAKSPISKDKQEEPKAKVTILNLNKQQITEDIENNGALKPVILQDKNTIAMERQEGDSFLGEKPKKVTSFKSSSLGANLRASGKSIPGRDKELADSSSDLDSLLSGLEEKEESVKMAYIPKTPLEEKKKETKETKEIKVTNITWNAINKNIIDSKSNSSINSAVQYSKATLKQELEANKISGHFNNATILIKFNNSTNSITPQIVASSGSSKIDNIILKAVRMNFSAIPLPVGSDPSATVEIKLTVTL